MHSIAVQACLNFVQASNAQTRPDMLRMYADAAKNALEAYLKATEPVDLGEEPYGEGCTCVSGNTR